MQPSSYFDKLFSILIVNFDSSIFSLKDLRISSAVCILRDVALISYASKLKHTSRGIHEEYRRGGGRGGVGSRGSKGFRAPSCTPLLTTHIKSRLFIQYIIAYYTFVARGLRFTTFALTHLR